MYGSQCVCYTPTHFIRVSAIFQFLPFQIWPLVHFSLFMCVCACAFFGCFFFSPFLPILCSHQTFHDCCNICIMRAILAKFSNTNAKKEQTNSHTTSSPREINTITKLTLNRNADKHSQFGDCHLDYGRNFRYIKKWFSNRMCALSVEPWSKWNIHTSPRTLKIN